MSLVLTKELQPGIVEISLNRPDKRNALSIALMNELCETIDQHSLSDACRVIILRGEGPCFCAGLDLKEVGQPDLAHESSQLVARLLETTYYSPKVTIATAHGAAVAGGAGLLSVCDFAFASAETKIGYPETRRGLVAAVVMTFLRRQLRERDARELLLTSELIDAKRAQEIGFINRVVSTDGLQEEALALARSVLKNGPKATAATKEFFDALWTPSVREDIKTALTYHREARSSEEAKEGAQAFLEKREPSWVG